MVSEDLDHVLSGSHSGLVHIDIGIYLVSRQQELIVVGQVSGVVKDALKMRCFLHVALASVSLIRHVRYSQVLHFTEVLLPLIVVVVVVVLHLRIQVVGLLVCKLTDDLVLLLQVIVVWIDQHVLVVSG